jgi:integrase
METTYDVRIWKTEVYKGKTKTSYYVRWKVDQQRFKEPFGTKALGESFRSELLAAARRGEAFRKVDGMPVSHARTTNRTTWFAFACDYMDFKWRNSSPGHRRNAAEALTTVTMAMARDGRGRPDDKQLRQTTLATLNPNTRDEQDATVVRWLRENTKAVTELQDGTLIHDVLAAIDTKLDGKKGSPSTYRRKRMTLTNALDYAVTRGLLQENPLPKLKATAPKTGSAIRQVEKRSVVNPIQARTLLHAVRDLGPHGDRLFAFFACMYHAGLRPEEAATVTKQNLSLPESGWGVIYLENAIPEIAPQWTDTRNRTELRGLKHRERGEAREVPCSQELAGVLRCHLEKHGTAPDGRLFRGRRGNGRLGSTVYGRVWAEARKAAFTEEVAASSLAKRPYDLRHACVSTWLAAGVEAAQVAEWAGHSVSVLMQVYAKCLDSGKEQARARIDSLMGHQRPAK